MTVPTVPPEIENFAQVVEGHLRESGARLSMGGEPTFLPLQPDGAEWSTEAMGPDKLGYARRFTARLIADVYPGGFAMQVFGKWYPGEALPRWNLVTLYCREGRALWAETERLHLDNTVVDTGDVPAESVAREIAAELGLGSFVQPAFEQETPPAPEPAAWVLPLAWTDGRWTSEAWDFRHSESGRLQMFMGDSPAGLRLPLYQIPGATLRSALVVEVKDGALTIFIPPLPWPAFRELVGRIEGLVCTRDLRNLIFCGYAPSDSGDELITYALAADPGVLEVNLPPARDWRDYTTSLAAAFKAAEGVGMCAQKLQLNGAVHGTGGGAHLAFGGLSEETNPFLADPRRIASVLRYWQHHPALSYAFTGQYVGPGSQAPRVDEGPRHGLYELEVACEGLERLGAWPDGSIVDQFLRNLLTDSAGNTHRAEICFDKFSNPSAPNGSLGIIELRAFETLPSVDWMARVALFIRAVLARLIREPFSEPLRRYGAQLHDRFFLPAFLWEDVKTICADLEAHGLPFDPAWLEAVFAFRFPVVGTLPAGQGGVEVVQALESWPLMAEEARGTAMVRVVDNSTDRLQVRLLGGASPDDGDLLVNGVSVPFEQVDGSWISGLRYKCASAYPALHPHVSIQSPLLFEWVDRASGKVTSSAHYHYWNPAAPVYDGRPRSIEEAAHRRTERWLADNATIGQTRSGRAPRQSPEYSHTLDLRRQMVD
ncbi:MAG: transglutaminase family protein [Opitutales bacterium]|nr:transglutaminase family protein [Opitutales bacterium]